MICLEKPGFITSVGSDQPTNSGRTASARSDQPVKSARTTSVGSDQPIEIASSSNSLQLNMSLNSQMSYMDKLMLKRSRKQPHVFTARPMYAETPSSVKISTKEEENITNKEQIDIEEEVARGRDLNTPSSCILTVDYSSFYDESNRQLSCIDISPIENDDLYDDVIGEVCSFPIISCLEEQIANDFLISTDDVDTLETINTLPHVKIKQNHNADRVSKNTTNKYSYKDMHEFYTIGVNTEKCDLDRQEITSSIDNKSDENCSVISVISDKSSTTLNQSSVWIPQKSYYVETDKSFSGQ